MHPITRTPSQKQNGFTLVEVMIAVLILSVSALAVGKLLLTAIGVSGDSRDNLTASQIAFEVSDTIRNVENLNFNSDWSNDYESIFAGASLNTCNITLTPLSDFQNYANCITDRANNELLSGAVSVNATANDGILNVRVTWNGRLNGIQRQLDTTVIQ